MSPQTISTITQGGSCRANSSYSLQLKKADFKAFKKFERMKLAQSELGMEAEFFIKFA